VFLASGITSVSVLLSRGSLADAAASFCTFAKMRRAATVLQRVELFIRPPARGAAARPSDPGTSLYLPVSPHLINTLNHQRRAYMDVLAYLNRIGYSGPLRITSETLRLLHTCHLETVPFENLDIWRSREIPMDQEAFARKVIEGQRGGFCYELNGAFR
jgi:hypothetical protein